ncbi:hypothetical protein Tco_0875064 [Tanacetum coccineum]|uniref:Glycine-rich protein n=1 Tax=Tanacetum coccineum TaxID=301880 RepID=A0ABQ5BP70_9ASTR
MKITMLIMLSLCLIANINASSNCDDYFIFDKAERAIGYNPLGSSCRGVGGGGTGASRGSSGTSGVAAHNIPAHGSGYLHKAAIHFDFLGHFRNIIRPVTEGGYKRGGRGGGGGGDIVASRGGIAASHGRSSMYMISGTSE